MLANEKQKESPCFLAKCWRLGLDLAERTDHQSFDLVPRLCLGTYCLASSVSPYLGSAWVRAGSRIPKDEGRRANRPDAVYTLSTQTHGALGREPRCFFVRL